MFTPLKRLRQLLKSRDEHVATALAEEAQAVRDASHEAEMHRQLGRESNRPADILLGRIAETGAPIFLSRRDLVGVSLWTCGATGSGKSAHLLALELGLVTEGQFAFVKIDGKGESAPWHYLWFLPAILADWSDNALEDFFSSYRVLNPFDADNLPELNVLLPTPGLSPALQAKEVARLVTESLGTAGGGTGHRMETILTFAIRLALAVGGLSLYEVRSILTNPQYLNGLLRFCIDQDVKEYFLYRFPKENRESLQAITSRLDLLLIDDTMRVLAARNCFDWPNAIVRGRTICDFGQSPRGAEYWGIFWLAVFFRGLSRAVLGRRVTDDTRPVVCSVDEWQLALGAGSDVAEHVERLLTLSRFRRATWLFANQLAAQVSSRHPALLATLQNSCAMQLVFRQSYEDARSLSHMFSARGIMARKRDAADRFDPRPLSPSEVREALVSELSRLPDRSFYFYYKKRGLEAVRLLAPTINFEGAKRAADQAPQAIRDACLGRRGASSRRELDEVIAVRRAHMNTVATGRANSGQPDWTVNAYEIKAEGEPKPQTKAVAVAPGPAINEQPFTADEFSEEDNDDGGDFAFLG